MREKDFEKDQQDKEKKDTVDEVVKFLTSEIGIAIDDPESKSKTSFYITRLTQLLLKTLSDTYGLPQGDIINWGSMDVCEYC